MLVCPVCKIEYGTSGDNQPRLLIGCGHTFCQKCLDEKYKTDENGITCPQCQLVTLEPHVPNITIMNYVEATVVPPGNTVRHPLPPLQKTLCQDCKKELATLVCFQCLPAGFKFCDSCSKREHSRPFGPVKEHVPKQLEGLTISAPVPLCKVHQNQPCLFFSSKVSKFACESCKVSGSCPEEEEYIPVDKAVAQVREDVPGLIQFIREKVDTIVQTRSKLDELLKRVDQEKTRAMDQVVYEFNQFDMALKKRLSELTGLIEEEAQFQKKNLLSQQERLELAQGNADTAIVRGNWLLQMADYNYLHQADGILSRMRAQLADEDFPLYQTAVTNGEIPVYMPADLLKRMEKLGCIGGGKVPMQVRAETDCGLLLLKWEQTDSECKEYEIRYEPVDEEDMDPFAMVIGDYPSYKQKFPLSIQGIPVNTNQKIISGIMPNMKYCFRIRSLNIAGWGIWSPPVVGGMSGFPLEIGHTGEIVELEIPLEGLYSFTARGAKAADGDTKKGGRGGIIEATFYLKKYDRLIILCGGMSTKVYSCTGGGGGTFVALNKRSECLVVAGGGGGTRGHDMEDHDGKDANVETESGLDGIGAQWAAGGATGGAGKDAVFSGPCWGYGGAGVYTASTKSKSFLHGGEPGEGGGFGGGGAVGVYGGGGGGGYSGGGGGRGGGGGGSYIREDGIDMKRTLGNEGHGSVTIVHVDAE